MFFRLTPFASGAATQPIFKLESRRLPWGHDARTMIRKSRNLIVTITAICLGIWAIICLTVALNATDNTISILVEYSLMSAVLLSSLGLVASIYNDFVSIAASLDGINGEIINGRWDLLRIANLREGYFVVSKHALAQIKAWRAVINVVALRVAAILLFEIALLIIVLESGDAYARYGMSDFFFLVAVVPVIGMLGLVFIIEPFWRMRTMTAIGLLVSAHTRHPSHSPLAAVGVMLAVWVAQTFVMFAIVIGVSGLLFPFFFVLTFGCVPFIIGMFVFVGMYGFYAVLQNWCIRRVAMRLALMDT